MEAVLGKIIALSLQEFNPTAEEPEVDPKAEGHLVQNLHLAYTNRFEIANQTRRYRRRVLERVAPALGSELDAELRDLRRSVSSVSTVSIPGHKPTSRPSTPDTHCCSNCWLRSPLLASEPIVGGEYRIPFYENPFFRYKPIPAGQTRILCLQPGTADQPLTIRILPMNRSDSGSYDALSYTWGSPTRSRVVVLNESLFFVTDSLYDALMYLRLSNRPRWLWADALCINQDDVAEKNIQIPMMNSIYRNAENVIVWIGEHANNSELALAGMRYLEVPENRKDLFGSAHEPECMERLNELYNSLLAFYRRPWFRRTWIRLEITVSRKVLVQCGRDVISWYAMKRSARRLQVLQQKIKSGGFSEPAAIDFDSINYLKYLTRAWRYGQSAFGFMAETGSVYYFHGGGLLELLMISREYEATDPRDKIYGVLGLARESIEGDSSTETNRFPEGQHEPPRFVVDYSKTVSEVYQHLAKYLINRDRNLDVLCILSTHRGPGSSDLPTWTPDWRVSTAHANVTDCWDYIGMKHAAAIAAQAEIQEQDDNGKLGVRAYLLDQIITLLDVTGDVCNTLNIAHFGPNNVEKHEAETKPFNPEKDLRRFCATSCHSHVLAPAMVEEGDLIVLLCGARLPFVVRPRAWEDCEDTESGMTFFRDGAELEVVGPCCDPVLMDGTIFERIRVDWPSPPKVFLV